MILAIAQTKGGVGKTTLAVNLTVERVVRARRDVLLVDADEQGSATDFAALRAERLGATGFTAVQLHGGAVRAQVLALRDKFQDVVIDTGGRDSTGLRAALTVADLAVLPFQPRSFDIWTMGKIGALIAEARLINPDLRAVAVINCADPSGDDNRAAADLLAEAEAFAYLDRPIGRRKAFANCCAAGLSVLEAPAADPKACAELAALADALSEGTPQ